MIIKVSDNRMELFGKPHIGKVEYRSATSFNARFIEPCCCEICGRRATNAHHIVPKGIGGGSRFVTLNGVRLRSPLIAVCGMGNASGCHSLFQSGFAVARWAWDDASDREMYVAGILDIPPHSPEFYSYGCYEFTFGNGEKVVYR